MSIRTAPRNLACASLIALSALRAAGGEAMAPASADLFGDRHVKRLEVVDDMFVLQQGGGEDDPKSDAATVQEHALVFQDGRTLRGKLSALTREKVVWQRNDASEPLEFKRSEIRRMVLRENGAPAAVAKPIPPGAPLPATIKLAGPNWLFGPARLDGATGNVSLKLGDDTEVSFPKAAVHWMHFARKATAAISFHGEALGMEGWKQAGNGKEPGAVTAGEYVLPAGAWIGRNAELPDRFELEFSTRRGETPRIFLQPDTAAPNTYSVGTIELAFRRTDLSRLIYVDQFNRENVNFPLPDDAETPKYRIFVDRGEERLVVMRKEAVVGDWKMRTRPAASAEQTVTPLPSWRGVCIDAGYGSDALGLRNLRIMPWDGVLPTPGSKPIARMIPFGKPSVPGMLESTDGVTARLNGKTVELTEQTTFDFAAEPTKSGGNSEALLTFNQHGEIAVDELTLAEGRIKASSALLSQIDMRADVVASITFPAQRIRERAGPDLLVFRNGDSLPGKLISMADSRVEWKGSGGAVWKFSAEQIAGTRIGSGKFTPKATEAILEFGNGDRLPGQLASLSSGEIKFRHALLGERAIPRAALRALYPNGAVILDAGCDPEGWLGIGKPARRNLLDVVRKPDAETGRVFLDGVFTAPPSEGGAWETAISRTLDKPPDRFELRFRVADLNGKEPNVSVSLSGNSGTPSAQVMLNSSHVRIYSTTSSELGFSREQEVSLIPKLTEHFSRREVRMFVDAKIGTIAVFVDGVFVLRYGKSPSERIPGIGNHVSFATYAEPRSMSVISDVWLGPWNGELPRKEASGAGVYLNNGDVAAGPVGALQDGKLQVGADSDAIDIPLPRITSISFEAPASQNRPAARARLADGGILNLLSCRWENGVLHGESGNFGAISIPEAQVVEFVFQPLPSCLQPIKDAKSSRPKKAPEPTAKEP